MSLTDILDAVSTLGTLGFALLSLYAFVTERVIPRGRLDEQRADKKEAMEHARQAIDANKRLADAVEASNRLDEARIQAEREARRA